MEPDKKKDEDVKIKRILQEFSSHDERVTTMIADPNASEESLTEIGDILDVILFEISEISQLKDKDLKTLAEIKYTRLRDTILDSKSAPPNTPQNKPVPPKKSQNKPAPQKTPQNPSKKAKTNHATPTQPTNDIQIITIDNQDDNRAQNQPSEHHEQNQHNHSTPKPKSPNNANKSKCNICDETFSRTTMLRQHQKKCIAQKFDCSHCTSSFLSSEPLVKHNISLHPNQYNITPNDSATTDTPPRLNPKQTNNPSTPKSNIKCNICPQIENNPSPAYPNKTELLIHKMTSHKHNFANDNLHTMTTPPKRNPPKPKDEELIYHPANNKKPLLNTCNICNLGNNGYDRLLKHIKTEHKTYYDLYRHLAVKHIQTHLSKCYLCNTTFYDFSELDEHVEKHRQNETTKNLWQYACLIENCTETTQKQHQLEQHLKHAHKNDEQVQLTNPSYNIKKTPIIKFYQCNFCYKSFRDLDTLIKHTQDIKHGQFYKTFKENQKNLGMLHPFQCGGTQFCCDRTFVDLLTLKQHQNSDPFTIGINEAQAIHK